MHIGFKQSLRKDARLCPLASFHWHPHFAEAMKYDEFRVWLKADMTQFYKLGIGRQMHTTTTLLQIIPYSSRFYHQYRQIKAMTDQLMRSGN